MKISKEGLDLIKKFEGVRLKAYQDIVGIWTIGYGSTDNVYEGLTITQKEADQRLCDYLNNLCKQLDNIIKVPLKQCQIDAICSFAYNLGVGALKRSTLLIKLNKSDFEGAAEEFLKWDMAKGKQIPGLTKRREAEKKLFLS